jgi:hypothetical protein
VISMGAHFISKPLHMCTADGLRSSIDRMLTRRSVTRTRRCPQSQTTSGFRIVCRYDQQDLWSTIRTGRTLDEDTGVSRSASALTSLRPLIMSYQQRSENHACGL